MMRLASIAIFCTLFPCALLSQTITVTNTNDSGPGTLRQAIVDVAAGGNIVFDGALLPATITLTSGEILIDKDLTITGPGADRLTISGNSASRVFRIATGDTVGILDIRITGGLSPPGQHGGAIMNEGALTLVQLVVVGNATAKGYDGSIAGSDAGSGGGIANVDGSLRVFRSTIGSNRTGNGGDCTGFCFSGIAGFGGNGGGIFNDGPAGTVLVNRSTVDNNQTGNGGSGGFSSPGNGAGVYTTSGAGQLSIESSTISGNWTGGGPSLGWGGAVFGGSVSVANSTIAGNGAAGGGGIQALSEGSVLTASNSIIAGNRIHGSAEDPTADCDVFEYVSNGYNLVGSGTGCSGSSQPDDLTVAPEDVFTTVIALSPYANGGPTLTYYLRLNSPAIDQGSCAGRITDQRGYAGSPTGPRIVDLPGPNADDGCDIGAYEYGGIPRDLGVYFKRPSGWGYPHIQYFDTDPDIGSTTWPGEPMVHVGCDWYWWRFDGAVSAHMVFNGNETPQTGELFRPTVGWFDGNTNTWNIRSPDPPCEDLVRVGPRVFLQGAYLGAQLMSRVLQDAGHLPPTQPYGSPAFAGTPLKHNGTEFNADLGAGGSVLAVDWSTVELWTGSTPDTKVAARAAILVEDGTLIDPVTLGQVEFAGVAPGEYHVVVRHRNHLPVMSKDKRWMIPAGTTLDFSEAADRAFGINPMVQMPDGKWAMWAADANVDGNVQALDFNAYIAATVAGATGYVQTDFNMDTNVQALDFNLYIANTTAGASSQVPE